MRVLHARGALRPLPKPAILRYEESIALVKALIPFDRKLRITGGEPLLGKDLADLVVGLDAPGAVPRAPASRRSR